MTLTYEVGDTITYIAFDGERRTGVVLEKYDNIKNGRPGFGMSEWWGYDSQIVRVRPAR